LTESSTKPPRRTSGSEKRRRGKPLCIRFNDQERIAIEALAQAHRQSPGALVRSTMLNIPLPRTRRPRIDEQHLARLLGELQQWRAELNKIGSNLNQLTKYANLGRTQQASIEAVMQDLVVALEHDLMEMRTAIMQVLGLEPNREI
jgi:hypothetical protein